MWKPQEPRRDRGLQQEVVLHPRTEGDVGQGDPFEGLERRGHGGDAGQVLFSGIADLSGTQESILKNVPNRSITWSRKQLMRPSRKAAVSALYALLTPISTALIVYRAPKEFIAPVSMEM